MSSTGPKLPVDTKKPAGSGDVQALLGPEPLLEGEDRSEYQALRDHVRAAVAPMDAIEEFWVRDVVDLLWETLRLRRFKTSLMRAAHHSRVWDILWNLGRRDSNLGELAKRWRPHDRQAEREVKAVLHERGIEESKIAAEALVDKIDTFERLDRLIAQMEARRNAVLREIERRRDAVARRLREAATIIEDGEFTEIDGPVKEETEQ